MKAIVAAISIVIVAIAGGASAGDLYSTDFEAPTFSPGDVNAQDSWVVGDGSGASNDGMIVDSGDAHGQVLQVTASDWGDEVKRDYNSASTLQYLVVEMDFQMKGESDAFWFMDNNATPGVDPDSIFWDWDLPGLPAGRYVFSNASPGITPAAHGKDVWYHVGIEVDQLSREITAFNFQGVWVAEDDSAGISTPAQLSRLIFRSWSPEEDTELLWIDNLSITDSSSTVIPEPATLTLLALAGLVVGLRRRW
jgi:hypothetical protein